MNEIGDSPFGFEDGCILSYAAAPDRLSVVYHFWNEKRGLLIFEGFLGMHDEACLGVTIGSTHIVNASAFIDKVVRLQFAGPSPEVSIMHYAFSDVDDNVVFEVIAKNCRYEESASNMSEGT